MVLRVYTFKMDEREMEEIDMLAKMLGKTRSDIIREALQIWKNVQEYKPKPKVEVVRVKKVVLEG